MFEHRFPLSWWCLRRKLWTAFATWWTRWYRRKLTLESWRDRWKISYREKNQQIELSLPSIDASAESRILWLALSFLPVFHRPNVHSSQTLKLAADITKQHLRRSSLLADRLQPRLSKNSEVVLRCFVYWKVDPLGWPAFLASDLLLRSQG